nr:seminal metalloprotease 1 isoform X3 [Megalopta genalis]
MFPYGPSGSVVHEGAPAATRSTFVEHASDVFVVVDVVTIDRRSCFGYNANRIQSWSREDRENLWELSGLFEGDIMLYPSEEGDVESKNGLVKTASRWPAGIVPYHIKEEDFDEEEIELIERAMDEYHESTCIRFRPYEKTDVDYVAIEGKTSGCWSLVGRHDRGQVLNLQSPGCVHHGVIVHELMHALGFYHQQSAADRDRWVVINWTNVKPGKEHNFNKYDNRTVTDYGIGYDYASVMHYSSHAFSKNGEPTITPKKKGAKLGQRKGLSEKDVLKLRAMYEEECRNR